MRRRTALWILGTVAPMLVLLLVLPASSSGYIAQLKRYPYLTDLVGTSVTVNWAHRQLLDQPAPSSGARSAPSPAPPTRRVRDADRDHRQRRLRVPVEGHHHRAQADTAVLLPGLLRHRLTIDLLGTDPSPTFTTQIAAGAAHAVQVRRVRRLGQGATPTATNPDQANVMSADRGAAAPASRSRPATTPTPVGSQNNYGDLYQTGRRHERRLRPQLLEVPGASIPLFPTLGNHGYNNSVLPHQLAAGHARPRPPAAATRRTPTAA